MLDPGILRSLRRAFEVRHREGTRATGALRITIETIAILLRVLELRVVAIARGFGRQELDSHRDRMISDLWSEPAPVRSPSDPDFDWKKLPSELHRAWLARLARDWNTLNWYYLDGVMKPPIFLLSDSRDRLGQWDTEQRTIAISGWHIATHSWHEVLESLKHEMAHQMVADVWGRRDATPHGPEFRAACARLRCSPRGTVDPGGLDRATDSDDATDRIVSRIRKLLALGRSPNQHEAALAMERASELLAKFNLDETSLGRERTFFRRCIGPTLARREEHHNMLATILDEHFFVKLIWVPSYVALADSRGIRMEIIGTRQNLDVAEYVHDYLSQTIEQIWSEHRTSDAYRGGRKGQFFAGLTRGFMDKLDGQRAKLVKERALVWKGDSRLRDHVAHLYPRLSRIRAGGVSRGEDYHIGVEQGREITLRMGVTQRSALRGGLLPPASRGGTD
jgi:hypothetical protein